MKKKLTKHLHHSTKSVVMHEFRKKHSKVAQLDVKSHKISKIVDYRNHLCNICIVYNNLINKH